MPDVAEASDGYVPPPRTGPKPFEAVDPNVVASRFPFAKAENMKLILIVRIAGRL